MICHQCLKKIREGVRFENKGLSKYYGKKLGFTECESCYERNELAISK